MENHVADQIRFYRRQEGLTQEQLAEAIGVSVAAVTVYQQIISYLHTFPTFITVHCIETAYNRSNLTCRLFTMCSQLLNKALAALRVSITTIHETMNECIVNTIFFSNIAKFE